MSERTARQKAMAAAADVLTQVRDLIQERGGKKTEDSVPEEEWNEIVERVAGEHGVPLDHLKAALVETGTVIKRRKKMN